MASKNEFLQEMAHTRDAWKSKVNKRLVGGLGEWYKYRLAEKAGLAADPKFGHLVAHWQGEALRLAGPDLADAYLTPMKTNGPKTKRRAFAELVEAIRSGAGGLRKWARTYLEKVTHRSIPSSFTLDDADLDEYLAFASETIEVVS